MINLIPPEIRQTVIMEYWFRVTAVFLFIFSVVCLVIILFSLPVYVLLSSQVDVYATSAGEAAMRIANYDLSAEALTSANLQAQKLSELDKVQAFTTVIEMLETLQNDEITLTGFELVRDKAAIAPVLVRGEAATRQALSDFRDTLLERPNVEEVILPISNLTKDRDIDFSLSVVFKDTASDI